MFMIAMVRIFLLFHYIIPDYHRILYNTRQLFFKTILFDIQDNTHLSRILVFGLFRIHLKTETSLK